MRRVLGFAIVCALAAACAACSKPRVDPLRLDGQLVTAQNQSDEEWTDVEIWINRQFRVTTKTLQAGQVFRAPLEHFVTGYGQQFRFNQIQIRDVRLIAKKRDGTKVEVQKELSGDSLSDALKGMGGKH